MKVIRHSLLRKTGSVFLLLIFLQSIFLPTYSWALTTGPHQPEYISYQEAGATDMVNLLTGDFSFSIPAIEIPGPEGGFSLPLAYNAGIGLDQEASWVGLGWTMNAGAITRTINEFPDDANGEPHSITVQDLTGVRGWTSSILGFGQIGWNSAQGHYGTISLFSLVEVSYNESGLSSVGVAGVSVSNQGIAFDPVKFQMAVITVATLPTGAGAAVAIAKQAAWNVAIGAASSAIFSSSTPSSFTSGMWTYDKHREQQRLFHKNYWIWLDKTRTEKMYGTLNLGNIQQTAPGGLSLTVNNNPISSYINSPTAGSASDMNQMIDSGKQYYEIDNPTALATDNFSVKAPGISGSISPYRLEIGSVSMPREMSVNHQRYSALNFLNYKVPFIYEGAPVGNYFYHVGGSIGVSTPTMYFGTTKTSGIDPIFGTPTDNIQVDDITFGQRIRSDASVTKRIPVGNHVEWLSNGEIVDDPTRSSLGFMDFLPVAQRTAFRSNFDMTYESQAFYSSMSSFSSTIPILTGNINEISVNDLVDVKLTIHVSNQPDTYATVPNLTVTSKTGGSITINSSLLYTHYNKNVDIELILKKNLKNSNSIGGYVITGTNGLNYHFALPSYDYELKTSIVDKNDSHKKTLLNRVGAFANTWLLTAITGPDFIDRGPGGTPDGIVDENDWGYWVKLSYGKYANDFQWRIPFSGDKRDAENQVDTNSEGKKQLYYLNSIETRTHVALFVKEVRNDSRAFNGVQSLRLNEVSLLKKEDYKTLMTSYGLPNYSLSINNICQALSPSIVSYMNQKAIRRMVFTYDYSLCQGTPNSIAGGKLTLKRLSTYGRNSTKVVPDYLFEYSNNPSYSVNNWDGWGAYTSLGTAVGHAASSVDSDGAAWSLTKVTNPLGSEMAINYERDTYSSISGQPVFGSAYSFNENRTQSPNTGINSMTIAHNGNFAINDRVLINGTLSFTCPTSGLYTAPFSGEYTITAVAGNTITFNYYTGTTFQCSGSTLAINFAGTATKVEIRKKGGNIRVASIIMTDQGIQHKSRYLYTSADGIYSSGVVAQELEYIKNQEFDFYKLPGYPITPVMYGRVTVLNGKLSDDNDWDSKQVYNFETPYSGQVTYSKDAPIQNQPMGGSYWTLSHHKIQDNTSQIGRVNSIILYSKTALVSQSQLFYSSQLLNSGGINNYQGTYSKGTVIFERVYNNTTSYVRYSKTTNISYPNVLTKVTNTKDAFVSESENLSWDFQSGVVNEKIDRSSLGVYVKTVMKPAYTIAPYAELGSKAINISYKNMLNQVAATYVYKTNITGSTNIGLISASVQTWKNDWNNYRYLNGASYTEGVDGINVWRKNKAYSYSGNYSSLRSDGALTFSVGNEFSFTGGTNTGWQQVEETSRYDHFSLPLETKDLYGRYSTSKTDLDGKLVLAQAQNANYFEFAYSGAEDIDNTKLFFGGEIERKDGTIIVKSLPDDVHTGNAAVTVNTNGKTFVYKTGTTNPITANRVYRASVWTKSLNGAIYYNLNGTGEQTVLPLATQKVGNWYQINVEIPVTSFTSLEVGVKSTSGTVAFDDFRFQPIDGALSANVYNTITGDLEYVLDNNNLFTRYEYNDRGLLTKTYRESIKYQSVKLLSENKDNFKRFNINQ